MFDDRFKYRYTTIPFAYVSIDYGAEDNRLHGNRIFHQHKEIEILIIRAGRASVRIEGQEGELALSEGDVVLIPPLLPHCYSKEKDSPFSHDCVCFDLSLLSDRALVEGLLGGALTLPPVLYAAEEITREIFSHISAAVSACRQGGSGWELSSVGHLSLAFSALSREGRICAREDTARDDFRARVLEILEKEYGEYLSSAAVADRLYMSHAYFCRRFRAAFGLRFMEYLAMFSIEKSKPLLARTERPVSEISLAVGFRSFSHFTKTFRTHTGQTPSEYRTRSS